MLTFLLAMFLQSPITVNTIAYDYTNAAGAKVTVTGTRLGSAFSVTCDTAVATCTLSGTTRTLTAQQAAAIQAIVVPKSSAYAVTSAFQADPVVKLKDPLSLSAEWPTL